MSNNEYRNQLIKENKNQNKTSNNTVIPEITDGTPTGEEVNKLNSNYYEEALRIQREQWAREDAIRKETQAREDTAYQRAVKDAVKAGINVNLMGVEPAGSGGGITNATGIDTSTTTKEMEILWAELEQQLDQTFQGQENEKDRIKDIVKSILTIGGIVGGKIL